MIDNLELILENDILAAYEKDGKAAEIRLEGHQTILGLCERG